MLTYENLPDNLDATLAELAQPECSNCGTTDTDDDIRECSCGATHFLCRSCHQWGYEEAHGGGRD